MNERGQFYPEIVGPFPPQHLVTIDGYRVPYITVTPSEDGKVSVTLDSRFGLDQPVPIEEFNRWIGFVANAMAVAAGYSAHGENCTPTNPHKTRLSSLGRPSPSLSLIDGGKPDAPQGGEEG